MLKWGEQMVRIAIVDDDPQYVECLKAFLERYQRERGEKLKISVFADGDEIALSYKAEYDIILMDVEMRFMDGMTAAEEIRRVDPQVVIIFITNMAQYAIKGYTVDALDYVLKPISYFAFTQRIDRALSRMEKRARKFIMLNLKGGSKKLEVSELYYVEVQDHLLSYHTAEGVYTTGGSMKEVEESLAGSAFFRCNKGYLVNLEHVEGFRDECAIVGGETVQVSRARKKEFLDAINDHLNEVGK